MIRFGIYSEEQFLRLGEKRRFSGPRVSYKLLNLPDNPTPEQIKVFEDISFTLRTSNGTFRTTYRDRFRDVDAVSLRLLAGYPPETALQVQDRAVSHGLTTWEWAESLLQTFPNACVVGSDILLALIELSLPSGESYIVEPNGQPLQYIKPPWVLSLYHPELWRFPLNQVLANRAKRRFERLSLPDGWMEKDSGPGFQVRKIPFIHPQALAFSRRNPQLQFRVQSVFEHTPGACHVLRTMNIFNTSYFSREQLIEGISAVYQSLRPGGLWIVGRTLEEDFSNHVAFFRRDNGALKILERMGRGSEIEELALSWRP